MKMIFNIAPALIAGMAIGASRELDFNIAIILLAISIAVTNVRIEILEDCK